MSVKALRFTTMDLFEQVDLTKPREKFMTTGIAQVNNTDFFQYKTVSITPEKSRREVSLYYDADKNRIGIKGIYIYEYTFKDRTNDIIEGISCISIPATRVGMLAAESVGELEYTSPAYKEKRAELFRLSSEDLARWNNHPINEFFHRPLMEHQVQFCALNLDSTGVLNGSEAGTGKTTCALALLGAKNCRRVLVVAPKDIVPQWKLELQNCYSEEYVDSTAFFDLTQLATSSAKKEMLAKIISFKPLTDIEGDNLAENTRIFVGINYESLHKAQEIVKLLEPDAIVLDESWKIANPDTMTCMATQNIFEYAKQQSNKPVFAIALTGNVIKNHAGDLYTTLQIVTNNPMPFGFSTYDSFCAHFANENSAFVNGREIKQRVGCKNVQELIELLGNYLFRVNKASCMPLPEKFAPKYVECELSETASSMYRELANDEITFNPTDLDGNRNVSMALASLSGGLLRKSWFNFQSATEFIESYNKSVKTAPLTLHNINWESANSFIVDTAKIDKTIDIVEKWLNFKPDGKLIVWCTKTDELYALQTYLEPILAVYGGFARVVWGQTPQEEIEETKILFNDRNSDCAVIIAQIRKLGAGHNLQGCDVMVYFSHTFSHLYHSQSTNRAERIGRTEPVHYLYLVGTGTYRGKKFTTIDKRICKALAEKKDYSADLEKETIEV